ncbi:MAG: MogA/MoaB family molybdenum cofactor biosynthesis protein [Anaerolineae bacterium]|nr:MogA/MoaB family molybdenum cofactor biosynthesis protein [Anaerolineae bacterium]
MRIAILTISDRSARGERDDISGPRVAAVMTGAFADCRVVHQLIVPDERNRISAQLIAWSDSGKADLIFTTGGTGFGPRDVTPEATRLVIERPAPGLAEAMRAASLQKTPHAMLSRGVCGIRGRTLIINLPGNPKAIDENLDVLLPVLPHAVELLRNTPDAETGHTLP